MRTLRGGLVLLAGMILLAGWTSRAPAETRRLDPIQRGGEDASSTPRGADDIYLPVERDLVRRAVRQVVDAWNRRRLADVLAPGFYDRERLLRVLETRVPQDARLRLIALRDVVVLDQSIGMPHPDGSVPVVSEVLAEVRTQITWNPPTFTGFRKVDGVNEYRLTLRYRLRPRPGS